MRVAVNDLIGRPGATRDLAETITRGDFDAPEGGWGPGDDALDSTIDLDLKLEMLVDGLLARGVIAFDTSIPCARCLRDVDLHHELDVHELYLDPARPDVDEDELEKGYELHVAEQEIDLGALLRDTVSSVVPVKTLHSEDCKGLCSVCGTDLNEGDCGHGREKTRDPRWAALEGLDLPPG